MDTRIHPLVVLHIADHHTREYQQQNKDRVLGALMGEQIGRVVNVYDAFELAVKTLPDNTVTVDEKTFEGDLKLFKEAYPKYECLGWYSTGQKIQPADAAIHRTMNKYNERPLYLLFNTRVDGDQRDLPISVYEEVVHISADRSSTEFVPTAFKIESEEAERVAAVHCAKVVNTVDSGSGVSTHYTALVKAITMFNGRIKVLSDFLKDVAANKIEADHKILRQLKGLVNRLPTMQSPDFREDFFSEINDAMLLTYLAAITKSTLQVNELMEKFNVTQASRTPYAGRSMAGPF